MTSCYPTALPLISIFASLAACAATPNTHSPVGMRHHGQQAEDRRQADPPHDQQGQGEQSAPSRPPVPVEYVQPTDPDQVARSLANPNTPLATLNVKNQFRTFEGNLPGADDQQSFTVLFQPSFPFPVGDAGDVIFWRPAIPVLFSQPVPDVINGGFDQVTGLGDIGMDLGYGSTSKTGFLFAAGAVASLPTATDSRVGTGRWTLGPELLVAQFEEWGLYGIFPNHQWDIAGWTDTSVNVTNTQAFLILLPGGAWSVGTTPIMSYDWDSSQWTVPINLTVSKTIVVGATPWKIGFELN